MTDSQASLYDLEGAVPHISLAKPLTAEWRELGLFVKQCDSLKDWWPTTDKNVWQSESTGFYKQSLRKNIKGIRTVEVMCDSTMAKNEEIDQIINHNNRNMHSVIIRKF